MIKQRVVHFSRILYNQALYVRTLLPIRLLYMTNKNMQKQFLESYDAYADAIYRYSFFRVPTREKAEELVQETFLRAWQYLESGNTVANMRAFLYTTLRNCITDYYRKHKELSLDAIREAEPNFDIPSNDHVRMETETMIREVKIKIAMLDEEEQNIILMRYMDDLDPKDIAAITGKNANQVSVALHRAMEKLKKKMTS